DKVERATTTAASLDASQACGNITKTQSTTIRNVPFSQGIGAGGSPRCQEATGGSIAQTRSERVPTQPHDSPIPRVNTLRSDEGRVTMVTPTHSQEDQPEDQLGVFITAKLTSSGGVSTASRLFSTTEESVSTAGASMPVSTTGTVQEVNKDKGKGIMIEYKPEQTRQSCSKDKKELVMKQL
ncbi:hypothetical protein Tco_0126236, partial [Tanacetum coccineum]